ncbi:MAG: YcxB family protein [Lachnospiraceae bacterium]|nr:YcxB family protein [Lachnospiraceae bacterium]
MFRYQCNITTKDLWKLSMYEILHSPAIVSNLIFAVAMVIMTVKFFPQSSIWMRGILIFLCLLFPVFQPLAIYWRANKQVEKLPEGLSLQVDPAKIQVITRADTMDIAWEKVAGVMERCNVVLLVLKTREGYMIPSSNFVNEGEKERFKNFVAEKIREWAK